MSTETLIDLMNSDWGVQEYISRIAFAAASQILFWKFATEGKQALVADYLALMGLEGDAE